MQPSRLWLPLKSKSRWIDFQNCNWFWPLLICFSPTYPLGLNFHKQLFTKYCVIEWPRWQEDACMLWSVICLLFDLHPWRLVFIDRNFCQQASKSKAVCQKQLINWNSLWRKSVRNTSLKRFKTWILMQDGHSSDIFCTICLPFAFCNLLSSQLS